MPKRRLGVFVVEDCFGVFVAERRLVVFVAEESMIFFFFLHVFRSLFVHIAS